MNEYVYIRGESHHPIACQIIYSGIRVRCADHRTRKENLWGAWNLLQCELLSRGWKIPQDKKSFIGSGGKVSFYCSY